MKIKTIRTSPPVLICLAVLLGFIFVGAIGGGVPRVEDAQPEVRLEPVFGEVIELFNGRDIAGWTAVSQGDAGKSSAAWSVVDGRLVCKGQPIGYLQTDGFYQDFELELEWRFDREKGGGNSGVLLRVTGPERVWPRCVEGQLHAGHAGDIWNIGGFPLETDARRTDGRRTRRSGPDVERRLGEWNRYVIRFDRDRLTLRVNDSLQNTATGAEVIPGRIGLQSEGAHIEFRNIRLRPIVAWRESDQ